MRGHLDSGGADSKLGGLRFHLPFFLLYRCDSLRESLAGSAALCAVALHTERVQGKPVLGGLAILEPQVAVEVL